MAKDAANSAQGAADEPIEMAQAASRAAARMGPWLFSPYQLYGSGRRVVVFAIAVTQ